MLKDGDNFSGQNRMKKGRVECIGYILRITSEAERLKFSLESEG